MKKVEEGEEDSGGGHRRMRILMMLASQAANYVWTNIREVLSPLIRPDKHKMLPGNVSNTRNSSLV